MTNQSFRTLAAGLLAASLSPLIFAQPDPLTEIVVTAKGNQELASVLPTSHILNSADIAASQAKDIPALLDQISGISVRDSGGRGSSTSVFLRGTSNSQIIVLVDGVRVGSATLGSATLNAYPIEAIDRIEVVKGPLSGIYGAGAVGGVIHLFTKKGDEGLGEFTATVGSNSLAEYGFAINGGNQKHSFRISAHAEQTDGIDRTSIVTDGNQDQDGFEEDSFSFAGKATLSATTIANLSVLYSEGNVEYDNTFGPDTGFMTDTTTLSTALNVISQISDTLAWSNTLGINKDESITTSTFPSDITTERDSFGSELTYQISDSSTFTAGVDYYEENIETTNAFPVTDRDNKAVFALVQSKHGAFGFVGNVRHDDNSAYGSNTNTSLAINYDFSDTTRAVLSYGSAFVAPSFNFLYFPFFGNPDLKPEESESYELSLIGQQSNLGWRVSAFRTDVENLFSVNPSTFLAENIGEAELQGVEFEVKTTLYDWNILASLDLLSAEDKNSGVELDGRADTTLALAANRTFGDLDLRLNLKSESERFDNRGTELPSYGLFDVSAKYQISDSLSVFANVDNVFDKDYTINLIGPSERYNTEGRQAKISVRYRF